MCEASLEASKIEPTPYGKFILEYGSIAWIDYTIFFKCNKCGWWGVRESGVEGEINYEYDIFFNAVIKKYDIGSKDIPINILRDYFERKKEKIEFEKIDPFVFEKLVAECLKYEFQPCEVYHVGSRGGKGDMGIDIYMVREEEEWLIQVKRRRFDKKESIETIRLLNGVLLREGKHRGMVLTSALSFSKNVQKELNIQTPGPYIVKLFNRGDIINMLKKVPLEKKLTPEGGVKQIMSSDKDSFEWAHLSDEIYNLLTKSS